MSEHCKEALEKLYAYLDRELDADSLTAIRTHVEECPPCGGAFVFEEKLLTVIRAGLREEVPQVVVDRIRAAIRTEIL
ncbi:MAG: zf-HC2 domain-containing protein [Acidimicrobiia bacterium]